MNKIGAEEVKFDKMYVGVAKTRTLSLLNFSDPCSSELSSQKLLHNDTNFRLFDISDISMCSNLLCLKALPLLLLECSIETWVEHYGATDILFKWDLPPYLWNNNVDSSFIRTWLSLLWTLLEKMLEYEWETLTRFTAARVFTLCFEIRHRTNYCSLFHIISKEFFFLFS